MAKMRVRYIREVTAPDYMVGAVGDEKDVWDTTAWQLSSAGYVEIVSELVEPIGEVLSDGGSADLGGGPSGVAVGLD